MNYPEVLPSGILIAHMFKEHCVLLEALQHKVFPHLAEEEILHAEQYKRHLEIFPEGQFVALDAEKVVGATTTMRYHYDLNHQHHHTFSEVMGGGWLTTHDPKGEWLYGIDVSVDPDYRKMGIAKALYRARQHLCRQLGLNGQLIVGMLNGYEGVKGKMSLEEYYQKVKNKELFDLTVSVQMKIGFEIVSLMKEYLHDPTCDNSGAMMMLDVKKLING
ncbi:MAG TPA: GNAT family N-acetyltransferase [Chitinophagales bacterium]|nr:GNAT family N-acetyltransferase [Chitinophagales bacterium]